MQLTLILSSGIISDMDILKLLGFQHCDLVQSRTNSWNSATLYFFPMPFTIPWKGTNKIWKKIQLYILILSLNKEISYELWTKYHSLQKVHSQNRNGMLCSFKFVLYAAIFTVHAYDFFLWSPYFFCVRYILNNCYSTEFLSHRCEKRMKMIQLKHSIKYWPI